MMHFFRQSSLHIDCFTKQTSVIEGAPIDNAMRYMPEWWKALPKWRYEIGNFYPSATMKTCAGMYDYYAKSVCIPLWTDLAIHVMPDGLYEWQFSDLVTEGIIHDKSQYEGFDVGRAGHLKIVSPWLVQDKSGTKWMFSNPAYSMRTLKDYMTLPGIVDYKYQHGTNIQLMINLERATVFNIPHRTPLAFLTPMSDKKVVVHRHLVDGSYFNKLEEKQRSITFLGKFKAIRKNALNKCPYKDHIK